MRDSRHSTNRSFHISLAVITSLSGIAVFLAKYIDPSKFPVFSLIPPIAPFILFFTLALTLYFIWKRNWLLIVLTITILLNTESVASYLKVFSKKESAPVNKELSLIVVTYNIHEFKSLTYSNIISDIPDYLAGVGADVICIQEYEDFPMSSDQEKEKAFSEYPHKFILKKSSGENGLAIFSRLPIQETGIIDFKESANGAIWANVLFSGKSTRILNVHMQTTGYSFTKNKNPLLIARVMLASNRIRSEQAKVVRKFCDSTKVPLIVCGDFNDPQESYVYRTVKGRLKDTFLEGGTGSGISLRGVFSFLRIDFILSSEDFECNQSYYDKVIFSDHYPLIAELEYQNRK